MHRALHSTSVSTTAIKFEATFHHHDLVKVTWRSSNKNSFWEKSQDNEKNSKTSFGRHLDVFTIFFLSRHLEEFPTNRHLENFRMLNNWIPLKKHKPLGRFHRSRSDFTFHHWAWRHRRLFEELRLRISSLSLVKKKVSTLEYERLQLLHRRNRSIRIEQAMKKEKVCPRHRKERTFFPTFYHYISCQRWDRRKRRASLNFFTRKIRRQKISTCE